MPVSMLSTSLITEPKRYGRFNALDTPQPTKPGMVLVSPTSISHTGTSATLGANGQVSFTAVSVLSLNGCFSADYDNYIISVRATGNDPYLTYRLRSSGTDDTGSNYDRTSWEFGIETNRSNNLDRGYITRIAAANMSGFAMHLFGPFLAQPTVHRGIDVGGLNGAEIWNWSAIHDESTSYDGITFNFVSAGQNMTGKLQVYGLRA